MKYTQIQANTRVEFGTLAVARVTSSPPSRSPPSASGPLVQSLEGLLAPAVMVGLVPIDGALGVGEVAVVLVDLAHWNMRQEIEKKAIPRDKTEGTNRGEFRKGEGQSCWKKSRRSKTNRQIMRN